MTYKNNLTIFLISIFIVKSISKEIELLLYHTNDMHAKFDGLEGKTRSKTFGGAAKIATVIKEGRKEYKEGKGPPVLYLDSGDVFSGSIWFTVHSYQGTAAILNELEMDAFNIGAHEFDLKIDGLLNFTKLLKIPILGTNIKFNKEIELEKLVKKSVIKIIDGVKIGLVGYLRGDLVMWAEKGSLEILDPINSLRKECRRLLIEENVKIIIALAHVGYEMDKTIAESLPDIDIIVGGNSNTFLYNGIPPDIEPPMGPYPTKVTRPDGTLGLVLQAYRYTKYLGRIKVIFNSDGVIKGFYGVPVLLDDQRDDDPDMVAFLKPMKKGIKEMDEKFLTKSKVYLDGTNCQYKECNFGNVVVDAIVEYHAKQYEGPGWTDAAVALMNSGCLVQDIDAPLRNQTIFYGDVLRSLPFSDILYIVEMKGSDLKFALEISTVLVDETSRGTFLLMSGLKVMFDFDARFGNRVKYVKIRCALCKVPKYFPLELEKGYKVIINSYLLKGGGGFNIIRDVVWNPIPIGIRDTNLLIEYFERVKYIIPETGGRIIPLYQIDGMNSGSFNFQSVFNLLVMISILFIIKL